MLASADQPSSFVADPFLWLGDGPDDPWHMFYETKTVTTMQVWLTALHPVPPLQHCSPPHRHWPDVRAASIDLAPHLTGCCMTQYTAPSQSLGFRPCRWQIAVQLLSSQDTIDSPWRHACGRAISGSPLAQTTD